MVKRRPFSSINQKLVSKMNLSLIRLKNETEELLLSITKNCELLPKQTHRKLKETFKLKLIKPKETHSFKLSMSIEGFWMIGLTTLKVYVSIFKITEENDKF